MGAGATGLAFVDALVAEADVEVTVIDRQPAGGGHWLHAYPFVRLHTPSAYYGVNSLALGEDRVDQAGENAGYYERATGSEVGEYFAEAAADSRRTDWSGCRPARLGRGSDGEQVRDLSTGELHDVVGRRKVVDARYLRRRSRHHATPFDVAPGARVVPVNNLPEATGSASRYAILGSGKTAADACSWLLDNGVEPDRIRGSGPATRGSMTAGLSAVGAGRRDRRGELHSMPRPARRHGTLTIVPAARVVRAAGPYRPLAAGNDVPRHDARARDL